jgi:carbamate kinase
MLSPPGPHPGRRVVLTLGGNALIRPGEKGSVGQQTRRAQVLAENLALLAPDIELVVTHGNGPQVGRTLLRSDLCSGQVPRLPIDLAVASTQGEMGILLQRAIELVTHRPTMALLTQVVVNPQDPGFENPRKFIGRFYTEEEARQRAQDLDWSIRQDGERGWRRVVASPERKRDLRGSRLWWTRTGVQPCWPTRWMPRR